MTAVWRLAPMTSVSGALGLSLRMRFASRPEWCGESMTTRSVRVHQIWSGTPEEAIARG